MSDDLMLSQEEIDALLNQPNKTETEAPAKESPDVETGSGKNEDGYTQDVQSPGTDESPERIIESKVAESEPEYLSSQEKDALGEIGNISMGTASTTLSELLQQRVSITSPKVHVTNQDTLFSAFEVPYLVIHVEFTEGLMGFNVLVMQVKDAMVMSNLMMGGDGSNVAEQFSEMEISAASEAMNQMIGTASTSLATMFSRSINISPPVTKVLESSEQEGFQLPEEDPIVVISFRLTIGQLVDTEVMQILSLDTAREEASLLWQAVYGAGDDDAYTGEQSGEVEQQPPQVSHQPSPAGEDHANDIKPDPADKQATNGSLQNGLDKIDQERLAMLMDIPLKATVVLGRTQRPIKDVLTYTPGAIVELSSHVEEPVEILVNGVLVARGEVVVVNENFGVKITDILTPAERVAKLVKSR